jgi:hypothetical protein
MVSFPWNFHQTLSFWKAAHWIFFSPKKFVKYNQSKYIHNKYDITQVLWRFVHIYLTFQYLISDIPNEVLPLQVPPLLVRLHLLPINRIHQMVSRIFFDNESTSFFLAKLSLFIYSKLEIKPCWLASRILDVEAFWYKTEIKIIYFVPLY